METLLGIIGEHYPVITAIIIVAVLTWKVAKYHSSVEDVKKTVNNLDCKAHREEIDELKKVGQTVQNMGEQLNEIAKWIMNKDRATISVLSRKCSPRQMTKIGRQVFKESKAEETLDNNLDFFLQLVEDKKPTTPFDVEDISLEVLASNLSNPLFKKIKEYLYYQPDVKVYKDEEGKEIEVRVSMFAILKLMSLELRDKYLEKHPEINKKEETN